MSADTVVCSYLHGNEPSHSFLVSLESLIGHDLANNARVIRGGVHRTRAGAAGIVDGRNKAVKTFLDDTTSPWLWIVDDDMGFAPDTVERLIASADPIERPVVGGLCFSLKEVAPDGLGGFRCLPVPTIYQWAKRADGKEGFSPRICYPINSLVRVAGTGAACLLVHRSILEMIRETDGDAWFDQVINPSSGERISEDLSFCYRVLAAGKPVYVDTAVKTTHYKSMWVAESDYWRHYAPPPATEPVDVIVPVLHRPQNVKPFMESLRASTGLATAWFVCDPDDVDEIVAVEEHGGRVLEHPGTFAEKANYAYRNTLGTEWLFLAGDDVKFRPGWLDHAQNIGNTHNASVVGTNDLGNPRVLAGEHATHMLIRRSYVDEVGASWDGPGVVAHEYRHWFVDDEIVTAAKQRGVWQMALGSIVEHMHPLFGKGQDDDVYRLGQASSEADREVFIRRYADSQAAA